MSRRTQRRRVFHLETLESRTHLDAAFGWALQLDGMSDEARTTTIRVAGDAVYVAGQNSPRFLGKNQFAGKAWEDAAVSKQLVDHYLGNIDLSRLELAVLALKCLYSRDTTQYFLGDQAYALMGLLRVRPLIDDTDSRFQAFAR